MIYTLLKHCKIEDINIKRTFMILCQKTLISINSHPDPSKWSTNVVNHPPESRGEQCYSKHQKQ